MKRLITKCVFEINLLESQVTSNLTYFEILVQHSNMKSIEEDLSKIQEAINVLKQEWDNHILVNHTQAMSMIEVQRVAFVTFEPTMHNIADYLILHFFPRNLTNTSAIVFRSEVTMWREKNRYTAISEL